MDSDNKYYKQFENYFQSNLDLLKILQNDNKQDQDKWYDDLFFPIPNDYISNWQNLIDFINICNKVQLNNNIITNVQKNEIIKLINENIQKNNTKISLGQLNFRSSNNTLLDSSIFPYSDFHLVIRKL